MQFLCAREMKINGVQLNLGDGHLGGVRFVMSLFSLSEVSKLD